MTSDSSDADGSEGLAPLLLLSPEYLPAAHAEYVKRLVDALRKPKGEDPAELLRKMPHNIALTGHYGSGKSSVLGEVLLQEGSRAINVSLSSLGTDAAPSGRIDGAGKPAHLTNLIQKEIVKQLLYRKPPHEMRGSQYQRVDPVRTLPAFAWSVAAGFAAFVVAGLAGIVTDIEVRFPGGHAGSHQTVAWLVLLGLSVGVVIAVFGAQHALLHRFSLASISAGGAAISLTKPENSFFDEYLDEIVFFFQKSTR